VKFFRRSGTLPLGVDIGAETVSVVSAAAFGNGFAVTETHTLKVPRVDADQLDLKVAETIGQIVRRLETSERRCVLAAPSTDLVTRIFCSPPGMRRPEAERAATLEADTIVDWPASERLVSLDQIPGSNEKMLLSIARSSTVERLIAIARAGGLRAVAVDVPACAWRRAVPEADAVLDCSGDRAELVVFGKPLGLTAVFPPRLIDERVAGHVRTALVQARRDGIADVQRLAILGSRFQYESIEALLRTDGYIISPVTLSGLEAPTWTFAFGLASWSIALRGLVAI
jgi:hypothetical protein